MTKERRLGRGLEALLGQLPGWSGTTPPGQQPDCSRAVPPSARPAVPHPPPADPNSGPATIPIRPLDESPPQSRIREPPCGSAVRKCRGRPAEVADRKHPTQSAPAPAGLRRRRVATPGREHHVAWPAAARGRSALGRRLPAHRRRTSPACRPSGRLERSAGDDRRGRRTSNGRVGHRREPAAQGPQRPGEGRFLPAIPGSIWRHPGGIGRAAETGSLDDRKPDSSAGIARPGAGRPAPRQDHARPRAGACCP